LKIWKFEDLKMLREAGEIEPEVLNGDILAVASLILMFYICTPVMSPGLIFGTISALYGFTNHIINTDQYSVIVGVVIASAIVPTLIANKFFLPDHLLEKPVLDDQLPDVVKGKRKEMEF
jgi:hypothetical protein